MKKIYGLAVLLFLILQASGQNNRYIVRFTNKDFSPYSFSNPSTYLTQRAIDRRTRYNLSIDSTDLPVTPRYLDSILAAGNVTILNQSKWLNAVSIYTTDPDAIARINSFPFVQMVRNIAPRMNLSDQTINKLEQEENLPAAKQLNITSGYFDYGNSIAQVSIHNGDFLHNIGLRGQNMVIGMVDAGFQNYLTVKAFDSARTRGQILGVYDFVAKDSSVNEDNSHGMQCLSTIAANIPGEFVGTAPYAGFYLFRSEDAATEYPIEEFNWVCAAERVDSLGGDLISSSLGYNLFDGAFSSFSHTYAEMNGNTTLPAIGADLAAKKGILVVNSAGNEGSNNWRYIITPADGDSVLAVGAVNSAGVAGNFSSYGPSADGRVKPDVASVGIQTVVQLPNNAIGTNNGTSFAAPNLAGLATCLWQGFPEFNNMGMIDALRKSGSIASSPDNRIGYGIPDMKKATFILLKQLATSQVVLNDCMAGISWTSKDIVGMKYEVERLDPGMAQYHKVGEVAATGNSFSSQSYQFTDQLNQVPTGTVRYRIRQVIDTTANGWSADYIDTVIVNNIVNCGFTSTNLITLMPNPAVNEVWIRVNVVEPVTALTIRLFNSKGQLVFETVRNKAEGVAGYSIPLYHLARGKYYVMVLNDEKKLDTKELLKL